MTSHQRLTADFLAHLEFERGLSSNTAQGYGSDLRQFGEFLQAGHVTAVKATHTHLMSFLAGLAKGDRPVGPATVRRKAACLRSFYRFLDLEGLIDDDPSDCLPKAPKNKSLPRVLSHEQVALLLAQLAGTSPLALRDRAMFEVMYGCGLRASETTGLHLESVDTRAGMLRAFGKGSKERIVPVGLEALDAIETYLQDGRPKLVKLRPERCLFVNSRGGQLTRQGLHKIVRGYATRAGLEGDMSPHTLRHTFATHVFSGGCDLRTLQEMLGHADVSTTTIYTHLAASHMTEAYFASHPRARVDAKREEMEESAALRIDARRVGSVPTTEGSK
ncbi:MAG: tyrosine recombinase [Solirubrobacteraceae bacterium]